MSQTCVDGSTVEIFRSNGYVDFFRWKQLGDWKETSTETWHRFESEFVALHYGQVVFFLYKVARGLTQGGHVGVQAHLTRPAMGTWEVCFAAGHQKLNDLYVGEPRKLAVHCIKCYAAWLDHHGM